MGERMTVARMMAALAELPPDAPLFIDGYEGGCEDATLPRPIRIKLYGSPGMVGIWGPHDEAWDDEIGEGIVWGYLIERPWDYGDEASDGAAPDAP